MDAHNSRKDSLIRRVLVFLMGMALIAGIALTAEAKDGVSRRALKEMITGAKSPADHKAIAAHFSAEAAKANAKAKEHAEMVGWYRQAGEGLKKTPYAPGTIDHCERLVNNYNAAAEEYMALAREHKRMAANK